ncbi:biotin carboxyl carrier protein [Bradyrhizobium sp. USDA 4502]
MAAARDQAARIVRSEPEMAEDAIARDASADLGEQGRADEAKRPAEAPPASAPEQPAASSTAAPAPKSGKRKFVMMGVVGLLALAAASYAAYYLMVGRFYVSTDDAYVRANNSMLGARVAGHIAAILPGDNALVRAGDVIFRIDDGDYRIAADAARTRIATQQATIERIGRARLRRRRVRSSRRRPSSCPRRPA